MPILFFEVPVLETKTPFASPAAARKVALPSEALTLAAWLADALVSDAKSRQRL
jgi:hypothetical protein